jgi:hypothetical protein
MTDYRRENVGLNVLDDKILELSDPDILKRKKKEAENAVTGLSTEDWKKLRRLCKTDLYFLATTILGYTKLSVNLHGHMCKWCEATDHLQFREILMPRGHFKSTILTIADCIRIALPDDSNALEGPRARGTNVRVLIAHETHEAASRFLFAITSHFLGNPLLMGLFPECVPNPKKNRINRYELELPRSEIWSEPTFDTMGVGGRGQGRHYNYLKLDDLFGDKARDSAAEREATYTWFDNVQSFFSSFNEDHLDLIGTRWAFDDLYSHAHEMYGDLLTKYIRSCEEPDPARPGKLIPIFPEMFPTEKLAILKKNQKVWQAQYVNNPGEGLGKFEAGWKRWFKFLDNNTIVITHKLFGADEREIQERINIRDLDIIFLIDPAMSGHAAFIITGVDRRGRVFVLKASKRSWTPPELVEELFDDVNKWRPRLVAIEAVTFSEVYHYWIVREQALRNNRFKIEAAKTRNRTKDERIMGLSNWYSGGLIYYCEGQDELEIEHDVFGASQQIHLLDALAYGPEFWKNGSTSNQMAEFAEQTRQLLAERDNETGYSR